MLVTLRGLRVKEEVIIQIICNKYLLLVYF